MSVERAVKGNGSALKCTVALRHRQRGKRDGAHADCGDWASQSRDSQEGRKFSLAFHTYNFSGAAPVLLSSQAIIIAAAVPPPLPLFPARAPIYFCVALCSTNRRCCEPRHGIACEPGRAGVASLFSSSSSSRTTNARLLLLVDHAVCVCSLLNRFAGCFFITWPRGFCCCVRRCNVMPTTPQDKVEEETKIEFLRGNNFPFHPPSPPFKT